jgi:hypothetical protein
MGKLTISQELSDKISNSLLIKQSDIDSGANKPIIRKVEPHKKKQDSPQIEKLNKSNIDSPVKKTYKSPKQNSPIKRFREEFPKKDSPIKRCYKYSKKLNRPNKTNELNYLKISKIVFISSIVGGIGITLGIKIGTILFL